MEWLVKKSHYVKKRACHVLVLCDSGGSLKMIAEANSMILLSPGDILSPLQDAQYC
ncbi:signal transduction protein PmrD, partial [Salmonella enterica subsp. enterica]